MTGVLVRAAALAAVYLLVLTSVAPGDVLVGVALGLVLAILLRPRGVRRSRIPVPQRLAAAASVALRTALEMVLGSWRVARFCVGGREHAGFVEIPRGDRTRFEVALWGVLTGEAPDEVVVDAGRDVLVVHLVDARNPDGIRQRHRTVHEQWLHKVAP